MNVNQITAQLRMMDDKQLAQFGRMHKNDPFMFPLAFNESNTRKELRAQKEAQMQEAPPVNAMALHQMEQAAQPRMPAPQQYAALPENTGIGRLDAGDVVHAASGGIVAFSGQNDDDQKKQEEEARKKALADAAREHGLKF